MQGFRTPIVACACAILTTLGCKPAATSQIYTESTLASPPPSEGAAGKKSFALGSCSIDPFTGEEVCSIDGPGTNSQQNQNTAAEQPPAAERPVAQQAPTYTLATGVDPVPVSAGLGDLRQVEMNGISSDVKISQYFKGATGGSGAATDWFYIEEPGKAPYYVQMNNLTGVQLKPQGLYMPADATRYVADSFGDTGWKLRQEQLSANSYFYTPADFVGPVQVGQFEPTGFERIFGQFGTENPFGYDPGFNAGWLYNGSFLDETISPNSYYPVPGNINPMNSQFLSGGFSIPQNNVVNLQPNNVFGQTTAGKTLYIQTGCGPCAAYFDDSGSKTLNHLKPQYVGVITKIHNLTTDGNPSVSVPHTPYVR